MLIMFSSFGCFLSATQNHKLRNYLYILTIVLYVLNSWRGSKNIFNKDLFCTLKCLLCFKLSEHSLTSVRWAVKLFLSRVCYSEFGILTSVVLKKILYTVSKKNLTKVFHHKTCFLILFWLKSVSAEINEQRGHNKTVSGHTRASVNISVFLESILWIRLFLADLSLCWKDFMAIL